MKQHPKKLLYPFAFGVLLPSEMLLPVLADESSPHQGVQITIKTDKLEYQPEEKIVFQIVVKNGLEKPLLFSQERMTPESDYEYRVVGDDQQNAPLTRYGKTILEGSDPFLRTKPVNLLPAQSYTNVSRDRCFSTGEFRR